MAWTQPDLVPGDTDELWSPALLAVMLASSNRLGLADGDGHVGENRRFGGSKRNGSSRSVETASKMAISKPAAIAGREDS